MNRFLGLALGTVGLWGPIGLVNAQTVAAAGGGDDQLQEVVVQAQRRAENLQQVPISISAFTAEALESRNVVSTQDLARITPGLQFGSGSTQRNDLFIRGIGSDRFDTGGDSSSSVFVDDVYQPRFSNLLLDLLDVERVEVLKGPQGTLYGRNTVGGAIAIYTPNPTEDTHVSVKADVGTKNLFGGLLSASGPLSQDWLGELSLGYRQRDGFAKDIVSGRSDDTRRYAARGKLEFKPDERLSILGTASVYSSRADAELQNRTTDFIFLASPLIPPPGPNLDHYNGSYTTPGEGSVNTFLGSVRTGYKADDVTLTSITAYQYSRDRGNADLDATSYDIVNYYQPGRGTESRAFSQEFRLSSAPDGSFSDGGKLKWVTGLYYYHESSKEPYVFRLGPDSLFAFLADGAGIPIPAAGILDTVGRSIVTKSYAAFGQATYTILPRLDLTVGGRYTRDEKSLDAYGDTNFPGFPLVVAPFTAAASKDWSKFTPKVSIDYQVMDDSMLYVTWARGYKSGAAQSVAFNALLAAKLINPESVDSYEAGWKSEWDERRIRFNVAAYENKFKNLQVLRQVDLGNGVAQPAIDNAASSTIRGVEVETTLIVGGGLRFDVGYNYLDAYYGSYVSSTSVTGTVDLSGNRMPRAPRNTVNVNATLDRNVWNGGRMSFSVGTTYTSLVFFQPENQQPFAQSGYATTNASIGYTAPNQRFDVTLWGSNLFDKQYIVYSAPLAPSGWDKWSDKRTAGITLRYRY